jgi:hypothetical protein
VAHPRYYAGISLEGMRKTVKVSVGIAGVPTESPNIGAERSVTPNRWVSETSNTLQRLTDLEVM